MRAELTAKQQRFADLVLGGMPASRAYREAGYSASSDRVAEAAGSRMLRNVRVAAYLAERRAAAASRAELSYAGILAEIADFARDKVVDQVHRLGAYKLVAEHLARITPVAAPVADTQGEVSEARAAALALGVLEAAIAGRLPIAQALEMVQAARAVIEPIAAATLARELRADAEQPAPDRPPPAPASDARTRPTWLKPAQVTGASSRAGTAA